MDQDERRGEFEGGQAWTKRVRSHCRKPILLKIRIFTLFCRYLDAIERAVASGDCLLLENIGESVDPVLDTLLGRLTIKKGRYIKIGDKEVEFNPKFRFILQVRT